MKMASTGTNQDPSVSTTVLVGVIGVIALTISIVGVQALFYKEEGDITQQYTLTPSPVRPLWAEQEVALGEGAIEEEDGQEVVRIPIARAMELVVQEMAAGPTDHGPAGQSRIEGSP